MKILKSAGDAKPVVVYIFVLYLKGSKMTFLGHPYVIPSSLLVAEKDVLFFKSIGL